MKIAAVSEDGKTISQHFGRAPIYIVVTVEDGAITNREQRDKAGHRQFAQANHSHTHMHEGQTKTDQGHGTGPAAQDRHSLMAAAISDCDAILTRGMGRGAYQAMQASGIQPVITDIPVIDDAVMAYVDGTIVDHVERLH